MNYSLNLPRILNTQHLSNKSAPNAGSLAQEKKMYINTGRIQLVENEAEYASLILREFAHIVFDHRSAESVIPSWGDDGRARFIVDLELWEEQEIKADAFVSEILKNNGYDSCAQSRGFRKVLDAKRFKLVKKPNRYQQIFLKRLKIMEGLCIRFNP